MFFSRASLVTLALAAASAKAVYFVPVDESKVVQCNTIELNVKGQAPFTISSWPGCDDDSETEEPLATYKTNETIANWKVNVAQGKSVMFSVEDATGNIDYSDDYTVTKSDDASCVGKRPSFSYPNPDQRNPTASTTSAGNLPTTQSTSSTLALNNVGGGLSPSNSSPNPSETTSVAGPLGGSLGGAMSNFSPRVELALLVVAGSSLASLLL